MKRLLIILLCLAATTMVSAQNQQVCDSTSAKPSLPAVVKLQGYRVQVFFGGATGEAKQRAMDVERSARLWFDAEHRVYRFFKSPHHVCQVGDFRTRKEAVEFLEEVRNTRRFPQATIVRSLVYIPRSAYLASLHRDSVEAALRRTDSVQTIKL